MMTAKTEIEAALEALQQKAIPVLGVAFGDKTIAPGDFISKQGKCNAIIS